MLQSFVVSGDRVSFNLLLFFVLVKVYLFLQKQFNGVLEVVYMLNTK